LHLRPGTREWYFRWLGAQHPELVGRYLDLYGRSAYAPKSYQARIAGQVRELADKHGVGRPRPGFGHGRRLVPERPTAGAPAQAPGSPAQASRAPAAADPMPRSPASSEQLTLL
ncbi:MAG TPA: hypothetical protein VNO25_19400, partial [Streptosporangiaceae bacterium]|nr:hypothetical protein [Streptosporangiaceae bacterium]